MVSFQHGTITSYSEAPTELPSNSIEFELYAGLASLGFIAVAPDLIGFGSSTAVLHPYFVEDATASAVIDMLKATKEFAAEQSIDFDSKLFLAGYSQGGYATMAAHKAIEQNGLTGFNLVASFPASGGYDVKAMQEYFFGLTTYDEPFYIAYVAMAYKTQYAWTKPLSDFFNEPYASRIPGLFDGSKNGSQINSELTTSIPDFIRADLRGKIDTDAQYKYIADAFNENSLTDWKPTIKMFMYHGDADVTVPYDNSVITYQKLINNGASTSVLSLTPLPGKDHSTGVLPYIEDFIPKMMQLK
jgi:pimeloyl-ACP methyl ester carboxylesterase